jgi:hypothetical protein
MCFDNRQQQDLWAISPAVLESTKDFSLAVVLPDKTKAHARH